MAFVLFFNLSIFCMESLNSLFLHLGSLLLFQFSLLSIPVVGSTIRSLIQHKSEPMALCYTDYVNCIDSITKFQNFRDVRCSTLKLNFFFCTKVSIALYLCIYK